MQGLTGLRKGAQEQKRTNANRKEKGRLETMANGTITINKDSLKEDGENVINAICEMLENPVSKEMFRRAADVFLTELCAYEFGRK